LAAERLWRHHDLHDHDIDYYIILDYYVFDYYFYLAFLFFFAFS